MDIAVAPLPRSLTLAQIGPEHFSLILDLLSAFDICNLFLSGNGAVAQLLAYSVTRFDLEYQPWERCKFPTLIRHFPRLEHLRIRTNQETSLLYGFDISAIPPTLKTLDLWFPNDLVNFLALVHTPAYGPIQAKLIDLSTLFPRLEIFQCMFRMPLRRLEFELLPNHLPRSLTCFSISQHSPSLNVKQLHLLPPNLYSWRFVPIVAKIADLSFSQFPTYLTTLHIYDCNCPSIVRYIPRTVTDLKMDYAVEVRSKQSELHFDGLPPGLIAFEAKNLPKIKVEHLAQLPRGLEKLSLDAPFKRYGFSKEMMLSLPPRLLHFSARSPNVGYDQPQAVDEETLKCFPSTLKTLEFYDDNVLLQSLSPNIEWLPTKLYSDCPPSKWHLLPRSLKALTLKGTMVSEKACEVPPGITLLNVFRLEPMVHYHFTSLRHLKVHMLTSLEEWKCLNFAAGTLETIDIDFTSWNSINSASTCPDVLIRPTSFSIHKPIPKETDSPRIDCAAPFLSGLTSLDLNKGILPERLNLAKNLTFLSIHAPEEDATWGEETFSNLPKLLTTIVVKGADSAFSLELKHIENLPRRLLTMQIETKESKLKDEDLKLLPIGIVDLRLPGSPHFVHPLRIIQNHLMHLNSAQIGLEHWYGSRDKEDMLTPGSTRVVPAYTSQN